jgi:arsenite methyltransferase
MTDSDHHDYLCDYYTDAAHRAVAGLPACCGPGTDAFGAGRYDDLDGLPDTAVLASIGCGNPTAVADLQPGETVLDLGSGGGIDVLLSARRVGPSGFVYGVDFTPAMLALACRNATDAGITNVEFLAAPLEAVPLPDASVDVIISNCVINLTSDKAAAFTEMHRLLRPGGRIGITDVASDDNLTADERASIGKNIECVTGALSVTGYRSLLLDAGFIDVTITITHPIAPKFHSAVIQAHRP